MCGSARTGVRMPSLEQLLDLARHHVRAQPRAEVDGRGLAQRHDRGREHDVVRDHDRVLAAGEGRVEQAERGDDALELAGEVAGLQPDAVADLERAGRDQHDARDQVAQRLLRGETEDDRDDRAGHGERPRLEARDVERDEHRRDQEAEAG